MTAPIVLHVTGDPAPKGSSRAMLRGGRAVNVPSGSSVNAAKLKGWKTAVTDAYDAIEEPKGHVGPVAVGIVFRFPLRKGDLDKLGGPKDRAPIAHITKPDIDKLVRSTLDALTSAGAWVDDAQVAICLVAKLYVPPGERLGADIVIGALEGLIGYYDVMNTWLGHVNAAAADLTEAADRALQARAAARRGPRAKRDLLLPGERIDFRSKP